MQPPRPRPQTTEESLRQMYITGRIEVEQFEYAIDKLLRMAPPKPRPIPLDTGQPETR